MTGDFVRAHPDPYLAELRAALARGELAAGPAVFFADTCWADPEINFCRVSYVSALQHGRLTARAGSTSPKANSALSGIYPCRGGRPNDYVYIYATRANNSHWERLLKLIGREEPIDGPVGMSGSNVPVTSAPLLGATISRSTARCWGTRRRKWPPCGSGASSDPRDETRDRPSVGADRRVRPDGCSDPARTFSLPFGRPGTPERWLSRLPGMVSQPASAGQAGRRSPPTANH